MLIPVGAMGKRSDPKAVVDSSARVIGVQGLRVVDSSSFPLLPPGHPQATICRSLLMCLLLIKGTDSEIDALAEKIAADILDS